MFMEQCYIKSRYIHITFRTVAKDTEMALFEIC